MTTQEEFRAWLEEHGVEVPRGILGAVRLKDVLEALMAQVIALEKRVAELEHTRPILL